ncbi:hypothetical protein [Mycobacteroides abscessus]|uniref:hypothetical protein n=1 Tax=Mycobacteroides abscessus TaxID=36809 RepID=UPI0012FFED82|nr:hypothetical protein [Mycobacteroides abscessus]
MSTWDEIPAAMEEYGEQLAPKLQAISIEMCAQKLEAAFRVSNVKKAMEDEARKS